MYNSATYIVIVGNPLEGLTSFYGPFQWFNKAKEWAEQFTDVPVVIKAVIGQKEWVDK